MPLADTDIRLLAAEVLDDTPEGGGRMTGSEIVDGQSNNLFPDVSELDRTLGRVNLRKCYPAVVSADREAFYGANLIVDQAPTDPNVSVTLFSTDSWSDLRPAAVSRLEAYLGLGPRFDGYLWGTYIAGQKAVSVLQRLDREPPAVGTTIVIVKEPGSPAEQMQYNRITAVSSAERSFDAPSCATFKRRVLTLTLADPLAWDVDGGEPSCTDDLNQSIPSRIHTTVVADAARYAGLSRLAMAAAMGDFTVRAESIFSPLVPSAQAEVPITDARPHGDSLTPVAAGGEVTLTTSVAWDPTHRLYAGQGIYPGSLSVDVAGTTLTDRGGILMAGTAQVGTVDYASGVLSLDAQSYGGAKTLRFRPAAAPARVLQTASWEVTAESRSGTLVFILSPVPAPQTLAVHYIAQGNRYVLRDRGDGKLVGADAAYGSGTLNYTTGDVVVTLGALPDVGTAVIASWSTRALEMDRYGGAIAAAQEIILAHPQVAPGTLTLTWPDGQGGALQATDDSHGALTGDASGSIDYITGQVHFAPAAMPPGGAQITAAYQYGDPIEEQFDHPIRDAGGDLDITLANPNVLPGTVEVEWNLLIDEAAVNADYYFTRSEWFSASGHWVDPIATRRDDGVGALAGVADSSVDYTTGRIVWTPDLEVSLPIPEYVTEQVGQHTEQFTSGTRQVTEYHHRLDGFRYVPVPAKYPADTSGWVRVRYRTTAAGNSATETYVWTPVLDLTPDYAEDVVPGSVRLTLGGHILVDRQGRMDMDIDPSSGAGTQAGTLDYATGRVNLTAWTPGAANTGQITALLTTIGGLPVDSVEFRTASAPIRSGSLVVQYQQVGTSGPITVTAATDGSLTGADLSGDVDVETGIVRLRFGRWVPDDATAKDAPWYDPAAVVDGQIWQPRMVYGGTIRYAATAYSYIPLDPDVLGLNPVRLPSDGRVPIFRVGDVLVLSHEDQTQIAAPSDGLVVDLGQTRLTRVRLYDAAGAEVPTSRYTTDLDAGTITLTDTTGLTGPLRADWRIEDMGLASDVQINGQITLTRPISHDFSEGAAVSSALVLGDLRARAGRPWEQTTWTGEWADYLIGDAPTASYNVTDHPIAVTNQGAITERWALIFTNTTEVRVVGEITGDLGKYPISGDIAIPNQATGGVYFSLDAAGWGGGWSAGNCLRFNTYGANVPVWVVRTIQQGPGIDGADQFRLQIRGDADR